MVAEVRIRSVHDGTTLTLSEFVPDCPNADAKSFLVSIVGTNVRAEARVSYFMAADLGAFFRSLAEQWHGWKGEVRWASLEGEFELNATSNRTGHVFLAYFLRPPHTGFHWELRGTLQLEAGQLEHLAQEVTGVWSAHAT
jgi:hypothetical protein